MTEELTGRVKAAAHQEACAAGRPVQYIADSQLSKEKLACQIAQRDGIGHGLIALFYALEPCYSFSVRGDRASRKIHLVLEPRKCTHLYHYYMHQDFGLMHVRVQSWFPFTVTVWRERSSLAGSANGPGWDRLPAMRELFPEAN